MSRVWPYDVKAAEAFTAVDPLRPFRCLLFMPFRPEFAVVAELVEVRVKEVADQLFKSYGLHDPDIKRIEWTRSSGVIQDQLWRELLAADLTFCDITEYNPNVMFEAGVASAWKAIHKVVFIKNKSSEAKHPFDISPYRYIEYELSDDGIPAFQQALEVVTRDAIIPFPDEQIVTPSVQLPLTLDFSSGMDDLRLYTPPYCHRRVVSGAFQFGSLYSYPHSWASIGNLHLLNVKLRFEARFAAALSSGPECKIGVGLRTQHFYANFGHILVLGADGSIIVTEPNNESLLSYANIDIRGPTRIDVNTLHSFEVVFNERMLRVEVDGFSHTFQVEDMKRVLGPGILRFHATRAWMDITKITLSAA